MLAAGCGLLDTGCVEARFPILRSWWRRNLSNSLKQIVGLPGIELVTMTTTSTSMNTTAVRLAVPWSKPGRGATPLSCDPLARLRDARRRSAPDARMEATLVRLAGETVQKERRLENVAMGLLALSGLLGLALAFEIGILLTQDFSSFSAWIAQLTH